MHCVRSGPVLASNRQAASRRLGGDRLPGLFVFGAPVLAGVYRFHSGWIESKVRTKTGTSAQRGASPAALRVNTDRRVEWLSRSKIMLTPSGAHRWCA